MPTPIITPNHPQKSAHLIELPTETPAHAIIPFSSSTMADPVKKPLTWSPAYPVYAEKHDMYRVFQELLKELIIWKPMDPLVYIRDELPKIAKELYSPRVFLIGPNVVTQGIGRNVAHKCGAQYLTLADIVETAPFAIRGVLTAYVEEEEGFDDGLRKLLVTTIQRRLARPDCRQNGYILFGFPQNRLEAICAQQSGLLPRQVFVLLPDPTVVYARPTPKRRSSTLSENVKSEIVSTKIQEHVNFPEMEYSKLKEVSEVYDFEICKAISHERWGATRKEDMEAELLANLIAVKPCGSPWIPKILILGPPVCGKSVIAAELSTKFSLVNVDFDDLVRGGALLNDDVARACTKYLKDLLPMNEEFVKALLQRRMMKDDCARKGWILHGLPDSVAQIRAMESIQLSPNRIFYLACPEDECMQRLLKKRSEILKRRLPGLEDRGLPWIDEMNFGTFPYGKTTFKIRYEKFTDNIRSISAYFGKRMIYVDASQKEFNELQFMEAAILRPPVIRYQDPVEIARSSQMPMKYY